MLVDKTSSGTGEPEKEEKWMSPIEFESFSGKANCRDWKRTIKVGGQQLIALFDSKVLLCHAVSCSCAICQNDSSVVGPIRPFVRCRRRKKDEIQAQNAYKKFLRLKPPTLPPAFLKLANISESDAHHKKQKTLMPQFKQQKNTSHLPSLNTSMGANPLATNKVPKVSKLISEVAQQMANVEEETWEPLEQVCLPDALFSFIKLYVIVFVFN